MNPEAPLTTIFTRRLSQPPSRSGGRVRLSRVRIVEVRAQPPRIRDGVRAGLPLAPSPILFGLSFGVLADASGFGSPAAVVMSATTFAGAAQFAAISVLGVGGTVTAAILAAVFLNARYVAISVTVASIVPGGKLRRLVESQAIVDESWALSGRRGSFEWPILVGSGLVFYVLWVGSTAVGTAIGDVLEDPSELGLEAAFAALFLALAMPYLRERRARQAAALAAVITLVLTPFAPAGVPIIAASAACLLGLRR
jgi:4-azaleucine resistance transporter AzlC